MNVDPPAADGNYHETADISYDKQAIRSALRQTRRWIYVTLLAMLVPAVVGFPLYYSENSIWISAEELIIQFGIAIGFYTAPVLFAALLIRAINHALFEKSYGSVLQLIRSMLHAWIAIGVYSLIPMILVSLCILFCVICIGIIAISGNF